MDVRSIYILLVFFSIQGTDQCFLYLRVFDQDVQLIRS